MPRSWLRTALFLMAATLLLAVPGYVGAFTRSPDPAVDHYLFEGAPTGPAETPGPEVLTNHVRDEVWQFYVWLETASGGAVPCGDGCIAETRFDRIVQGLLERCEKVEPAGLRTAPAFDPVAQGELIGVLERTCSVLSQAQVSLGKPQENPGWRIAVQKARSEVIPGIRALGYEPFSR